MSERNEIDLAKIGHAFARLAEINDQTTELLLEISQTFLGLTERNANIRTGRKVHRPHSPALDPVNDSVRPTLEAANRVRTSRRRAGA